MHTPRRVGVYAVLKVLELFHRRMAYVRHCWLFLAEERNEKANTKLERESFGAEQRETERRKEKKNRAESKSTDIK